MAYFSPYSAKMLNFNEIDVSLHAGFLFDIINVNTQYFLTYNKNSRIHTHTRRETK